MAGVFTPYSFKVYATTSDDAERNALLLADFFDNAAVGLHWVGVDGVILRVNRAELQLLGYREDEYVGRHVSDFHADPPVIDDILKRLSCGETLHSYEARLRCKDGTVKHVLISSNVLWEDGRFVHTRCFTRDITTQKLAQLALLESERHKRAILDASLDAIVTMDHQGLLLDFNAAAQSMFGYAPDQALGKPLAELIIPQRLRELHRAGLERYLRTGTSSVLGRRLELSALRADGLEFPVELSISRVPAEEPAVFTATLRDITDRKRVQDELHRSNQMLREALEDRRVLLESERAARSAAERLSEIKDEFLATLSHELRTPLSAILGWAHILRASGDKARDLAKGLDIIERNARIQTRLIDELLDTSRITSGKVKLDMQPLDPATLLRAAIESVAPAAQAKGIHIGQHLDPGAQAIVGDQARLHQVCWNLLANAIKFTPQAGTIDVGLEAVDGGIEISVSDSGCGIAPDFLPHVFERFRQADASTTRRHGGLGLGLAIVRSLVEQHGGTVEAASEGEGRGAVFTVRLPAPVDGGTAAAFDPPALAGARQAGHADSPAKEFHYADLTGLSVLVVDDEPDARALLERILAECSARTLIASSAMQALQVVADEAPDILVSDIGMPDVDGYELMRRLRATHADGRTLPAIALTAFARPEDRERALAAGFDAHLSKPVEPSELIAKIAALTAKESR